MSRSGTATPTSIKRPSTPFQSKDDFLRSVSNVQSGTPIAPARYLTQTQPRNGNSSIRVREFEGRATVAPYSRRRYSVPPSPESPENILGVFSKPRCR